MKKLFETDINEDFRRAIVSQYFLMIFTFLMAIVVRAHEETLFHFSFIVELILLGIVFKFYFQAQKFKNYAYWGITFLLGVLLVKNIFYYTFLNHDLFILYITFLAFMFLGINSYVMSSPLFYPRVQWWEYDFRYRGDLKTLIKLEHSHYEARLTDFRRSACCVEAFDYIDLDREITLEILYKDKTYIIDGVIKTNKVIVPGRPIRYGIKFDINNEDIKVVYNTIRTIWNENKRAKIRSKFSENKTNEIC